MAGSQNPECAINALVTLAGQATGGLNDYVDAVNAEWGDNITIDYMKDYWRAQLETVPDTPCSVIEVDRSRIDDRTRSEGSYGMQQHFIQWGVLLTTRASVSYQGRTLQPLEDLNIRIEREMHAIQQFLEANPRLTVSGTDNCDRLFVREILYPPIGQVPDGSFLKSGIIKFDIWISP